MCNKQTSKHPRTESRRRYKIIARRRLKTGLTPKNSFWCGLTLSKLRTVLITQPSRMGSKEGALVITESFLTSGLCTHENIIRCDGISSTTLLQVFSRVDFKRSQGKKVSWTYPYCITGHTTRISIVIIIPNFSIKSQIQSLIYSCGITKQFTSLF